MQNVFATFLTSLDHEHDIIRTSVWNVKQVLSFPEHCCVETSGSSKSAGVT